LQKGLDWAEEHNTESDCRDDGCEQKVKETERRKREEQEANIDGSDPGKDTEADAPPPMIE
jgi:hypothetical protein